MTKIIITGKNGYISNQLKKKLEENEYEVELIDLRNDEWKNESFADVSTIVHCAALVHKNEKEIDLSEYNRINAELTKELAQKAKKEGVLNFVFLSTRAVYGKDSSCFKLVEIDEHTPLKPYTKYGISKLKAEEILKELEDETFKLSIIRPPFIYGAGCKGNYGTLRKLVLKIGIIPTINNQYSMMYIDNLIELIYQIIIQKKNGLFLPQDYPFHSTVEMAELIAKYNEKKVLKLGILNPFVKIASVFIKKLKTAFGNEIYKIGIDDCQGINYRVVGFEDSIKNTEKR